ncbi:sugar transferase [bacterium]|nr:sugar transferase [bacterium]
MNSSLKDRLYLVILDFIGTQLAYWVVVFYKYGSRTLFNPIDILPSLVSSLFWVILFTLFGLYDKPNWETSKLDEFINIFKAIVLGILIIFFAILTDMTKTTLYVYGGLTIIVVFILRILYRILVFYLHRNGIALRNSIIIGLTEEGFKLEKVLNSKKHLGYNVIGFVAAKEDYSTEHEKKNILGTVEDLPDIVRKNRIQQVLIAYPSKEHDFILKIMGYCATFPVEFKVILDFFDIISGHKSIQVYGAPLIKLFPEPFNLLQRAAKRILDIIIPWTLVVCSAPLCLLVMIAIKLDSEGGILYRQIRVGKHGKLFTLYKFRSMYKDAEKYTGPIWAKKNDPRVTKLGRILRRTRIDEIPQFINVIRGDMSLVGPRPERPHFVKMLRKRFPLYMKRLNIKPGLTGWAQVKHKYDTSLDDVKEKLKYDLFYIENFTLLFDIKIIARTIWVALTAHGAH